MKKLIAILAGAALLLTACSDKNTESSSKEESSASMSESSEQSAAETTVPAEPASEADAEAAKAIMQLFLDGINNKDPKALTEYSNYKMLSAFLSNYDESEQAMLDRLVDNTDETVAFKLGSVTINKTLMADYNEALEQIPFKNSDLKKLYNVELICDVSVIFDDAEQPFVAAKVNGKWYADLAVSYVQNYRQQSKMRTAIFSSYATALAEAAKELITAQGDALDFGEVIITNKDAASGNADASGKLNAADFAAKLEPQLVPGENSVWAIKISADHNVEKAYYSESPEESNVGAYPDTNEIGELDTQVGDDLTRFFE